MANWAISPSHGLDYSFGQRWYTDAVHDDFHSDHLLNTIMPFTPHLQFTIIHLYATVIFALLIRCCLYFTDSVFLHNVNKVISNIIKSRQRADDQMEQNAGAFIQVLELQKLCSQSKIYPSDTCIPQPTKVQTEPDFTGIIPRAQN